MTRQICDKAIINEILGLVDCTIPIDEQLFDSTQKLEWPDRTNCWRNYRATWSIINKQLYLTHIEGKRRVKATLPIRADWFTGRITILTGEILEPTPLLQFAPITEFRTNLYVISGKVQSEHKQNVKRNWFPKVPPLEFHRPTIPRNVVLARFLDE